MSLSTAPLPLIFYVFIILPVVLVVVLTAGIFVYFWFVKKKPNLVMIGVAVLVSYGLLVTYVGLELNARETYFVEVDMCNAGNNNIEGWTIQDGRRGSEVSLRFPSYFGSGYASFGDAPTVQTYNFKTSDWMDLSADGVCGIITEQSYIGVVTNGFKTIQFIKFFDSVEDDPLEYSVVSDILVQKEKSFSSGWFSSSAFQDGATETVVEQCARLSSQYNNIQQIDYAFAAEVAKLTEEGKDPFDFAWRVHVLPNLSSFQTVDEAVSDFNSCSHEQHINSWPILVSDSWIVFEDGCEGVFDGCIPAREQVFEKLYLSE